MIFPDQGSAKSLFIRKVLEQAEYEGVAISAAQQYMLAWSESDPSFKQDSKLNSQFEQEISQGEYEKKIQDFSNEHTRGTFNVIRAKRVHIARLTGFLVREIITS